MKDYWKTKLTPWDTNILRMVESLTGKPCEAKNGGDSYFFEADYDLHREPEYILAIWDAIEGRAGERLVDIKDDPDRHCIIVHVAFSQEAYPGGMKFKGTYEANPHAGNLYIDDYGQLVLALRVQPSNAGRLVDFIGNGEMEIREGDGCVFRFLNDNNTFATAIEGEYIVFKNGQRFAITPPEEFVATYHLFQ